MYRKRFIIIKTTGTGTVRFIPDSHCLHLANCIGTREKNRTHGARRVQIGHKHSDTRCALDNLNAHAAHTTSNPTARYTPVLRPSPCSLYHVFTHVHSVVDLASVKESSCLYGGIFYRPAIRVILCLFQ